MIDIYSTEEFSFFFPLCNLNFFSICHHNFCVSLNLKNTEYRALLNIIISIEKLDIQLALPPKVLAFIK